MCYINHYATARPTFMIIYRWILLRMRNVSYKSCRENQNTHFVFNSFFFFRKSYRLWDNLEKYCTAVQDTDDSIIRRMRCACRIIKATNTHSQYVIVIAFPLLQSLHERAAVLRYTYIYCLVRVLRLRMVSSKTLVTRTLNSHEQQKGQVLIKYVVHAWAVTKTVVCIYKYIVMGRITTFRSTTDRIFDGCPIIL
jgi:hypothetical protein